ncbi:MAG: hypothetical protein Q9210_006751 [Variospora velana]
MAEDRYHMEEDLHNYLQVIGSSNFATSCSLPNASNPVLSIHGLGRLIYAFHTEMPQTSLAPVFFDKHRDTEKAPGMFSTFVVALPSEHTDGDVVVQLGDDIRTLQTQGHADFACLYLGWYADVNHSVSKVVSGHRLVLTYNLVQRTSSFGHLAFMLGHNKQNLNDVLARRQQHERNADSEVKSSYCWEKLVYLLEHEYSEANLSIDQLKGKDQSRIRYLVLGSVDEDEDDPMWAAGAHFHEFIDELEWTWKLKTIFRPNGQILAHDVELEEDEEIINSQNFQDLQPDDEE